NGFDHSFDIRIGKKSVHRQAQYARTDLIRIRTSVRTELRKRRLTMQWNWIMDKRWNAAFREKCAKFIALRGSDYKQVIIALSRLQLHPNRQFMECCRIHT